MNKAISIQSIAGIERWADTMELIYLRAHRLTDIERVASLKLLEFANLIDTPIRSLAFLGDNSRLVHLHIGGLGGPLPDLTPLCDLQSLQYLHIWGDHSVDLSALAGANDLEVEIIGNTRPVHGREKLPPSVKVRSRK